MFREFSLNPVTQGTSQKIKDFPNINHDNQMEAAENPWLIGVGDLKYDAENSTQEASTKDLPRSVKIWNFYKRVLTFPANTVGIQRTVGVSLYIISFSIAITLIFLMYTKPTAYYTEGLIEFEEEIQSYHTPDIILCPYWYDIPGKYHVQFSLESLPERYLDLVRLSFANAQILAEKKYNACGTDSECKSLDEGCYGPFAESCRLLQELLKSGEYNSDLPYLLHLPYVHELWKKNGETVTLEILWIFSLDPGFLVLPYGYISAEPKNYDYKSNIKKLLRPNITALDYKFRQVWVGNRFCWLLPSFHANRNNPGTRDLGALGAHTLWIGSLKSQTVTHGRDVGYLPRILFSVVEYQGDEGLNNNCKKQDILRGTRNLCSGKSTDRVSRYYSWSVESEEFSLWLIYRSEIRPISHEIITRKIVITSYSKFQIAASLFSCCVGHSVLQIVYLLLSKLESKWNLKAMAANILGFSTIIFLTGVTFALGRFDLSIYLDNRYNWVFKQRMVPILLPVIELHSYFQGFINCSMTRSYNMSSELFVFQNFVNFGYFDEICHEEVNRTRIWEERYVMDRQDLGKIIQEMNSIETEKGKTSNAAELIRFALNDLKMFMTNCRIGEDAFDCLEFLEFHLISESSSAFVLRRLQEPSNFLRREKDVIFFTIDTERMFPMAFSSFLPQFSLSFSTMHPSGLVEKVVGEALAIHLYDALYYSEHDIAFDLEISTSFRNYLSHPGSRCAYDTDKDNFNIEYDIFPLFQNLHTRYWCRCLSCGTSRPEVLETVQMLTGDSLTCCSIAQIAECYLKYLGENETIPSFGETDLRIDIHNNVPRNFSIYLRPYSLTSPTLQNTSNLLNMLKAGRFDYYGLYDTDLKKRVIDLIERTILKPCQRYQLHVSTSVREKKTDRKFIDFSIKHKSQSVRGIVEIDRFNLSDFLGVLLCSYGFIFGVGLVGIVEIVMSSTRFCGNKKRRAKQLIRTHLMRSMNMWLKPHPVAISRKLVPKRDVSKPDLTRKSDFNLAESEGKDAEHKENQVKDRMGELKLDQFYNLDHNNDQSYAMQYKMPRELHVEDLEPRSIERQTEYLNGRGTPPIPIPYNESLNRPTEKQRRINVGIPASERIKGYIMLLTLLVSGVCMIMITLNFFESSSSDEFNTIIESEPTYQPPSIIICTRNTSAENLLIALRKSICITETNVNNQSCSSISTVFFRTRNNRSCFLFENISERNLNPVQPDLVVNLKYFSAENIAAAVYERGSIELENVEPTLELDRWSTDATIYYQLSVQKNERNCYDRPNIVTPLRNCNSSLRVEETPCCVSNETCFEPFRIRNTCTRHTFHLKTFNEYKFPYDLVTLTVGPETDFAKVTTVRQKFDAMTIFSIVGGFVGSFIEFTVLNFLSLLFLVVLYCFKLFQRLTGRDF